MAGLKKYAAFITGMLALVLLLVPAGQASAHGDHRVATLTGAEKNKAVANMLRSDTFKATKKQLQRQGYNWLGVSEAEAEKLIHGGVGGGQAGDVLVAVPILDPSGHEVYLLYALGYTKVVDPSRDPHH